MTAAAVAVAAATASDKDLRTRLIKNCIENGIVLIDASFNLCCAAIADIALTKPESLHCFIVNPDKSLGDTVEKVHPKWAVIARDYVAKLSKNDPGAHKAIDELFAKATTPDATGTMAPAKIQIPEMRPLEVVLVHDAYLHHHPCSACGRRFKSVVNARRCAAASGSRSAYVEANLAKFWDSLDAAARMQLLPVGLVAKARELPHSEDTAARITGGDLFEAIHHASEGTTLFVIPRGSKTVLPGDVRGTMDIDAALADKFMEQLLTAFSLAGERELLGMLDKEEKEMQRKKQKNQKQRVKQQTKLKQTKQAKQAKVTLARLMTDASFLQQLTVPLGRSGCWWEEEEELDVEEALRRCSLC